MKTSNASLEEILAKKQAKAAYDKIYNQKNREKRLAQSREYYQRNKSKCLADAKEWQAANKDKKNAIARTYRRKNKDKCAASVRAWRLANWPEWQKHCAEYRVKNRARTTARERERLRTDTEFKLQRRLRGRLRAALKAQRGCKSQRTLELVGTDIPALRAYLEELFQPGMTWENYGPVWHVDHIRPCASFDLTDPEQQKQCFHYTNLQPLWAADNINKGARW